MTPTAIVFGFYVLVLAFAIGGHVGQWAYRRMLMRSGLLTKADLKAAPYLATANRRRMKEARVAESARRWERLATEAKEQP